MNLDQQEVATAIKALEFYMKELTKEMKKSRPGLPIHDSCKELYQKADALYNKLILNT